MTCWMTSPARCTRTVSPTRMSLRRMSSSLCSVACEIVTPPTCTGLSRANLLVEAPGIGLVKNSQAKVPSSLTTIRAGSFAPVVSVAKKLVPLRDVRSIAREKHRRIQEGVAPGKIFVMGVAGHAEAERGDDEDDPRQEMDQDAEKEAPGRDRRMITMLVYHIRLAEPSRTTAA